jgi:hypothetical protein
MRQTKRREFAQHHESKIMKARRIVWAISMLLICGFAVGGSATEWLTGTSLTQHLSEPVDLVWSENPVREAINSLARVHKVAVLLDRRIDPRRKITLALKQTPLDESLTAIAMASNLGVALAGSVAYFGPTDTAAKLRTLIFLREEDAKKKSATAAKKLLKAKPLAWEDFSQPREILERLGRDNELSISGLENIPYDLWAAADLPPLTLVERISLIAVQYDLTLALDSDGKKIELVPLPADVRFVRNYPGGKKPEETAKRFAELAPQAEIKVGGEKVFVKGMVEDHQRIDAPRLPGGRTAVKTVASDLSAKRFTLTVAEKPIGPLLTQLANQIGLQLQMDKQAITSAGVSLDQRVSFKVEDATLDQLLQAAIKEAPLKYRRQGNVLIVEPMK